MSSFSLVEVEPVIVEEELQGMMLANSIKPPSSYSRYYFFLIRSGIHGFITSASTGSASATRIEITETPDSFLIRSRESLSAEATIKTAYRTGSVRVTHNHISVSITSQYSQYTYPPIYRDWMLNYEPRLTTGSSQYLFHPTEKVILLLSNPLRAYHYLGDGLTQIGTVSDATTTAITQISSDGLFLANYQQSGHHLFRIDHKANSLDIGEHIGWGGSNLKWDATGKIAALGTRIVRFEFPGILTESVLPSDVVAFHSRENIVITAKHVCRYDPNTLEVYDVEPHNTSFSPIPTVAFFSPKGLYLVTQSGESGRVYRFTSKERRLLLYCDGTPVYDNDITLSGPFTVGPVEPGIRELDLSVGNHLGETVKDLVITATTEHENDTVELSTSKDPFEPQQTLTFEGPIQPDQLVSFYARINATKGQTHERKRTLKVNASAKYAIGGN